MNSGIAQEPATKKVESRFPSVMISLIVLAGAAARALLLFSTPLVPGMNGAYYLVQARSLLQQGKPGIPHLPLTFVIQAILARIEHCHGVRVRITNA